MLTNANESMQTDSVERGHLEADAGAQNRHADARARPIRRNSSARPNIASVFSFALAKLARTSAPHTAEATLAAANLAPP